MRILICDDNPLMVEEIHKYIQMYFKRNGNKCPEVICYTDGESLLSDEDDKDLVFLDIEMPGFNGIYIGNELKRKNPKVIIFVITAFTEYLDDAMRFHVFRYLSKPLDQQRFFRNMDDALALYHTYESKIPVETKEGLYTLSASLIVCIEAIGRKVIVHTLQRDYESVHNMQYWKSVLPHNCFFQTHRSFIVNLEHVTDFDHSLIHLAENQFQAYLTRRKYSQFKEAYLLYLEHMR